LNGDKMYTHDCELSGLYITVRAIILLLLLLLLPHSFLNNWHFHGCVTSAGYNVNIWSSCETDKIFLFKRQI